jgi:hypothetical protein
VVVPTVYVVDPDNAKVAVVPFHSSTVMDVDENEDT